MAAYPPILLKPHMYSSRPYIDPAIANRHLSSTELLRHGSHEPTCHSPVGSTEFGGSTRKVAQVVPVKREMSSPVMRNDTARDVKLSHGELGGSRSSRIDLHAESFRSPDANSQQRSASSMANSERMKSTGSHLEQRAKSSVMTLEQSRSPNSHSWHSSRSSIMNSKRQRSPPDNPERSRSPVSHRERQRSTPGNPERLRSPVHHQQIQPLPTNQEWSMSPLHSDRSKWYTSDKTASRFLGAGVSDGKKEPYTHSLQEIMCQIQEEQRRVELEEGEDYYSSTESDSDWLPGSPLPSSRVQASCGYSYKSKAGAVCGTDLQESVDTSRWTDHTPDRLTQSDLCNNSIKQNIKVELGNGNLNETYSIPFDVDVTGASGNEQVPEGHKIRRKLAARSQKNTVSCKGLVNVEPTGSDSKHYTKATGDHCGIGSGSREHDNAHQVLASQAEDRRHVVLKTSPNTAFSEYCPKTAPKQNSQDVGDHHPLPSEFTGKQSYSYMNVQDRLFSCSQTFLTLKNRCFPWPQDSHSRTPGVEATSKHTTQTATSSHSGGPSRKRKLECTVVDSASKSSKQKYLDFVETTVKKLNAVSRQSAGIAKQQRDSLTQISRLSVNSELGSATSEEVEDESLALLKSPASRRPAATDIHSAEDSEYAAPVFSEVRGHHTAFALSQVINYDFKRIKNY